ncbi:MAG: hypothetical protein P8J32_03170 [bacterium]|nr:hypothetical protein [bacterium]
MKKIKDIMGPDSCQSRQFAHIFDTQVFPEIGNGEHGTNRGSDYIGGYGGVGWYEYYRCYRTDHIYVVYCTDGVNGGSPSHNLRHLIWAHSAREYIQKRTRLISRGEIRISWREWCLMSGHNWLDPSHNHTHQSQHPREVEGVVGTFNGRRVIVDPKYRDDLPKIGYGDFPNLDVLGRDLSPHSQTRRQSMGGGFNTLAAALGGLTLTSS